MKKIIIFMILLLVSLCVGCENTIYQTSIFSDVLNNVDINERNYYSKVNKILTLDKYDGLWDMYDAYYFKISNSEENKYVCGYIDPEKFDIICNKYQSIISQGNLKSESGTNFFKDSLMYMYGLYLKDTELKNCLISWYDLNKSNNIPNEINNKKLLIVFEYKLITIFNISKNQLIARVPLFYENYSFSNYGFISETERNNFYDKRFIEIDEYSDRLLILGDKLSSEVSNYSNCIFEKKALINIKSSGFEIQNINDQVYIKLNHVTTISPLGNQEKIDLKEKYEYLCEEYNGTINYLFKLEEIKNLILEIED